jgi:hypothetical protein
MLLAESLSGPKVNLPSHGEGGNTSRSRSAEIFDAVNHSFSFDRVEREAPRVAVEQPSSRASQEIIVKRGVRAEEVRPLP